MNPMSNKQYNGETIRLTFHALGYTQRRGFTPDEVENAIKSEKWQNSEKGRLECSQNIPYGREWNGKHYTLKQIRPIFVVESDEIIVVTVYTYYF